MLPLGVPVVIPYTGSSSNPNWLKNYREHLNQKHGADLDIFDLINREGENAAFRIFHKKNGNGNRCFVFRSEPEFTLFLLKWD